MTCIDKSSRLNEINFNKFKNKMKIIEYNNSSDIKVKFENGYIVKSTYTHFKNGTIKNPYNKKIFNVGFLGEMGYRPSNNKKMYKTWTHMIERCYDEKFQQKHKTYIGCSVCEEWHNFQNFAKWYEENYYEVEGQKTNLDKDILRKGNKIYSPETCIFVPYNINILFVRNCGYRGNTPIGVTFYKRDNKYDAQCNNRGNNIYLGRYDTPEKAFYVYKTYKEKLIKTIANEYKNKIPKKLYEKMCNYKVEITD